MLENRAIKLINRQLTVFQIFFKRQQVSSACNAFGLMKTGDNDKIQAATSED